MASWRSGDIIDFKMDTPIPESKESTLAYPHTSKPVTKKQILIIIVILAIALVCLVIRYELKFSQMSSDKQMKEKFEEEFGKLKDAIGEEIKKRVQQLHREKQMKEEISAMKKRLQDVEIISKTRGGIAKSCADILKAGITNNGDYLIDPDAGGPAPPFKVWCSFTDETEVSVIKHDSMGPIIVNKCKGSGCFKTTVTYRNVTMKQIKALTSMSQSCKQMIKFDCFGAPLQNLGYWLDSDGKQQHYFDGDEVSNHTCSCGRNNSCNVVIDGNSAVECNCNAPFSTKALSDTGMITDKQALPITGFVYGNLVGKANVTIGWLECSGYDREVLSMTSCKSLSMNGALSGYYLLPDNHSGINNTKQPIIKYCNTTDLEANENMLGHVHTKELAVKFAAIRSPKIASYVDDKVLNFSQEVVDTHDAFSPTTGKFTVPVKGIYKFDITAWCDGSSDCWIDTHVNANKGHTFYQHKRSRMSIVETLELEVGDTVYLKAFRVYNSANRILIFIGQLF